MTSKRKRVALSSKDKLDIIDTLKRGAMEKNLSNKNGEQIFFLVSINPIFRNLNHLIFSPNSRGSAVFCNENK